MISSQQSAVSRFDFCPSRPTIYSRAASCGRDSVMLKTTLLIAVLVVCICIHAKPDFEPYKDNSGTVVGIAGRNYCLLAADSRLSEQYMIHSRNFTRIFELSKEVLLTGTGCLSDLTELTKIMSLSMREYQWKSDKKMSAESASFLLSKILYQRCRS